MSGRMWDWPSNERVQGKALLLGDLGKRLYSWLLMGH